MRLGDTFDRSARKTVIITLSAFAGGFAGNFWSTNPGSFEKIGATIGLLALLFPTIFAINLMLDTPSRSNKEAQNESPTNNEQKGNEITVEVPLGGKVVVMDGNSNVIEDTPDTVEETNGDTEVDTKDRKTDSPSQKESTGRDE